MQQYVVAAVLSIVTPPEGPASAVLQVPLNVPCDGW
jgi:hypothetical protein